MWKRDCDAHSCFANNIKGECDILKDTDWSRKKGKACPFYAHRDKEREAEDGRHNE